jgi:hypothetical protein
MIGFLAFAFLCGGGCLGNPPPYPISRGFCQANLNGSFYDLTPLQNRTLDFYDDDLDWLLYYFRPCQQLTKDDIGDSDLDLNEVLSVRCLRDTPGSCVDVGTKNTFDFRFINPDDPSQGVIYRSEGEPFTQNSHFDETVDVELVIHCDPTQTDPNVSGSWFYERVMIFTTLQLTISSAAGCPRPTAPPTPTPTPWAPKCQFTRRDTDNPMLGVTVSFDIYNNDPYGARVPLTAVGGFGILYVDLCERASCPFGYRCVDDWSSAWLCNSTNQSCVSYGVITDGPYVDLLVPNSTKDGVRAAFGKFEANITCSPWEPPGHVFYSGVIQTSGLISMNGSAWEVCRTLVPSRTPDPRGSCIYEDHTTRGELVSLNLSHYGAGWNKTVSLSDGEQVVLMYMPCGDLHCPGTAFCDGDEDATVWLCLGVECFGYGLYENPINLAFNDPTDASKGVGANYRGNIQRSALVTWLCDEGLSDGQLRVEDNATLYGQSLSFRVWASEACFSVIPPTPAQTGIATRSPWATTSKSPGPTATKSPSPTAPVSKSPQGGAAFLMAVLVVFVGYVAGGVAVGLARDHIGFPNDGFWEEVGLSTKEGLMAAVGPCGSKEKAALGASESGIETRY